MLMILIIEKRNTGVSLRQCQPSLLTTLSVHRHDVLQQCYQQVVTLDILVLLSVADTNVKRAALASRSGSLVPGDVRCRDMRILVPPAFHKSAARIGHIQGRDAHGACRRMPQPRSCRMMT